MCVAPARFVVEPLESRRLMSATPAFMAGGTLFVTGSSLGSNEITVARSTLTGTITVNVATTVAKTGVLKDVKLSFPEAAVKRVVVTGGKYDDSIAVGAIDPDFALAVWVTGGKGNNVIMTSAGDDHICTGDGNDNIDAGDGNNVVNAGKGDDTITTGIGKDRIHAGDGNDWVDSGAGDDLIFGGGGNDILLAGDGNDTLHGQRGDDILHGGNGNDTLWGGLGNDSEYGEAGDDTLGGVLGTNTLIGGEGHDRFLTVESAANSSDYNAAEDLLTMLKKKTDGDDLTSV